MSEVLQATPLSVPESAALRYLPEGPIPLGEGRASWVGIQHGSDAKHGSLNLLELESETNQSYDLPGRPGFAFPCQTPGRFVVGCERSLGFFDVNTGQWTVFCDGIDADVEGTIINDGLAYEDCLIFGTKDLQFATKKAGLYLYRGNDRALIRLRDDQICSNGKSVITDPDGGLHLLDIDSPTRQVVRYPLNIESGQLGDPRVVLDFAGDPAVPDGAIVTPDQTGIIVSMFRPEVAQHGETRLYDLETGQLRCTWQTAGSPQNTCPALIPHQGQLKLLITTAVEHMSPADQQRCPNAGKLFLADTDIEGDLQSVAVCYKD